MSQPTPDQFYTGLVADLYEDLAGERASGAQYTPFLDRYGTPALELCCGSGLPLLDLLEAGYDVDGLDASLDMLDRCRSAARARGLTVNVRQGLMQSFSLPRRYQSIFLAGASFTLLTSDRDAETSLRCIHEHLQPGGTVLIPLETIDLAAAQASVGVFREAENVDGEWLRCGVVDCHRTGSGNLSRRLRYERRLADGGDEVLERDWVTRDWSQTRFGEMLEGAGFEQVRMRAIAGGPASVDATSFAALATRRSAR